jgi:hypothetical protein
MDKGYDYQEVRDILTAFGLTAHIRSRVRKPKSSNGKRACELDVGWWGAAIVG